MKLGLGREDGVHCLCTIDGRPDYSRWSSDDRMKLSVKASIGHIHKFIAPQALIIGDQGREDNFFINSVRSKALALGKSLIELPSDAAENMMWITRLDSGSLAGKTSSHLAIGDYSIEF